MDFLTFFKKHYEKVLLSVVLVALAAATIYLLFRVSTERRELEAFREMDVILGTKALPTVDVSTNQALIDRLRRPDAVLVGVTHNLFNPVTWKRLTDGNLRKIVTGNEVGPGALLITETVPLMLKVSYAGARVRESSVSHAFKVTREAHRNSRKRSPITLEVVGAGAKNDVFILRQLKPTIDDPKSFVLEMIDERRIVTVSQEEPYEGVAGYMVDLSYPPDKMVFPKKRLGDRLVFAGDTNTIVAIGKDSVTVEATSNRKRTTVNQSSAVSANE